MATHSVFPDLLSFLQRLEAKKVFHRIERHRADAIMVIVDAPGRKWEVEFLEDGTVDVEEFVSTNGVIGGRELLDGIIGSFDG